MHAERQGGGGAMDSVVGVGAGISGSGCGATAMDVCLGAGIVEDEDVGGRGVGDGDLL